MRITRVRLQNIGPHQHFQVDLDAGLIGIVGANGAGKSTLVNSIYAALTNDFSRFSTVKSDIIRNGSGTEPSFIQLEGTHRGQEFLLTRSLRPSGNEFTIGSRVYTKANEVNDAVTAELNITKSVIDKYVFVDQWQMFGFLNETASERAKTFQFLCGTEIASQIHKACADYVTRQQGIEIVDNSVELEAAIAEAKQAMDEAKKEGKEAEAWILSEEALDEAQKLYRAGTQVAEAKEAEARVTGLLTVAIAERETLTNTKTEFENKLKARQAWLKKSENDIAAARAFLKSQKSRENVAKLKKATAIDLSDARLMVKERVDADKCKEKLYIAPSIRSSTRESIASLTVMINAAKAAQLNNSVCETCLQPIDAKHKQKLKDSLDENEKKRSALVVALNYSEQYDKEESARQQSLQSWIDTVSRLEAQLKDLQSIDDAADPSKGSLTVETAKALLRKEAKCQALIDTLLKQIEATRTSLENVQKDISKKEARVQAVREIIESAPSTDEFARIKKELRSHHDAVHKRSMALGSYRAFKRTKSQTEETLAQLKLRLAEKSKIRNLLDTISTVGDVFHWNQLPKTVSQANLELLIDDINSNLKLFNNPFVVEADSDLTFRVFLPGQPPVKAKQLSGGQKVILAIAFRAALDRVFGHDVGMMFLDEPTAGLDADNVNFFHEALQQLAQKVGHSRQLVVITHVQELGTVFDQLIEVKKG